MSRLFETGTKNRGRLFPRPLAEAAHRVIRKVVPPGPPSLVGLDLTAPSASGNVLGDDLDPETLDLITRFVGNQEDVPGLTEHQKAQLHEIAFWRWVAFVGYNGQPPAAFPAHQRGWMLENFRRTGWSSWWLRYKSVAEIGCGPLGMIEFLPGRRKAAFDPLNSGYDKLFRKVRRNAVEYFRELGPLVESGRESFDLAICFNVLDHATDPRILFDAFMALIRPNGRFLFQLNVVKAGEERPEAHARMHPSPFTREEISAWLDEYSKGYRTRFDAQPTADNEYFFMAWGRKNRGPALRG